MARQETLPSGTTAAVILASSIGTLVLGVLSMLLPPGPALSKATNVYEPIGFLNG